MAFDVFLDWIFVHDHYVFRKWYMSRENDIWHFLRKITLMSISSLVLHVMIKFYRILFMNVTVHALVFVLTYVSVHECKLLRCKALMNICMEWKDFFINMVLLLNTPSIKIN